MDPDPRHRVSGALCVAVACLALAVPGCKNCDVHGGTSCYGERDDPTAAQRAGIEPTSLGRRLRKLERRHSTVAGVHVNRWGELWIKTPGGATRGTPVPGEKLGDKDASESEVEDGDPFPLSAVSPGAVRRVLRRARRRGFHDPFISADLTRDDAFGGLTLTLKIGNEHKVVSFEAPYDGSQVCVKFDGSNSHRCPHWRRQPPGIPG